MNSFYKRRHSTGSIAHNTEEMNSTKKVRICENAIEMDQAEMEGKALLRRCNKPTLDDEVELRLFVSEKSFAERLRYYLIKDQTISLRIRLFKFTVKLLSVICYIVRAGIDDFAFLDIAPCCEPDRQVLHQNCTPEYNSTTGENPEWKSQYEFPWRPILWVNRPTIMWITQVSLAILSFAHEMLSTYANYKGNLIQQIISVNWFLEIVCSVPLIVGIFLPVLRCVFVPIFLNIWLAKSGLSHMVNDLHRATHRQQSAMFNQVLVLLATLVCLISTCICGVEHLERAGQRKLDMFDSLWFVVVTFSTVGYGDLTPTIWPSRVLVIVIIFIALSIIPTQLEEMSFIWAERQRQGGEYSRQRAETEKHVVVCATVLRMDVILDFLNEFYAHTVLQKFYVVLISPCELDGPLKSFLQIPIWSERVIFIQGSVLRDADLHRVKMGAAEACFILTSRQEADRRAADEKTILRAMAVKDFAPQCPLYVQILRPESKLHVRFADQVICDEELKFVLLAMNSYVPGISTVITLLAHTSKGQEGRNLKLPWKREFGKSAGNEIYSVVAHESIFFGDYIDQKFSAASMLAHAKCGATLFALQRDGEMRINPGNETTIREDDLLFYICLTEEENAVIVEGKHERRSSSMRRRNSSANHLNNKTSNAGKRRGSMMSNVSCCSESNRGIPSGAKQGPNEECSEVVANRSTTMTSTTTDFPSVLPYIGHTTPTMCHLLNERAKLCCLRLERSCGHCQSSTAYDYKWPNPPIIICCEFASPSLFNIMLPLRGHHRVLESLNPIIFLLEHSPDSVFLNTISCFPMVYYMLGTITGLNSFLCAGVTEACYVIIVDRESSAYAQEEYMADSRQLVATQTMFELFPQIPVCLELTYPSNMRFMHFLPPLLTGSDLTDFVKEREQEKICSLPYLFRDSFACGKIFSSSMLDTLLYQSFIKDYLPTLLRVLVGLQYTAGSGHLDTHVVTESEAGKSYHEMFKCFSRSHGYVLLGIYRYIDDPGARGESHPGDAPPHTSAKHSRFHRFTGSLRSPDHRSDHVDSAEEESDHRREPDNRRRESYDAAHPHRKQGSAKRQKLLSRRQHNLRHLHEAHSKKTERENLDEMIRTRMRELNLPDQSATSSEKADRFGYIMLNPAPDVALVKGDLLYIIVPEMTLPCNGTLTSLSAHNSEADMTSHNNMTSQQQQQQHSPHESLPFHPNEVFDEIDSDAPPGGYVRARGESLSVIPEERPDPVTVAMTTTPDETPSDAIV